MILYKIFRHSEEHQLLSLKDRQREKRFIYEYVSMLLLIIPLQFNVHPTVFFKTVKSSEAGPNLEQVAEMVLSAII